MVSIASLNLLQYNNIMVRIRIRWMVKQVILLGGATLWLSSHFMTCHESIQCNAQGSRNSDLIVKLGSSNVYQYSLTAVPISCFKCFSCNMRPFVTRQATIISCWTDEPKPSTAQLKIHHPVVLLVLKKDKMVTCRNAKLEGSELKSIFSKSLHIKPRCVLLHVLKFLPSCPYISLDSFFTIIAKYINK